MSPIRIGGRRSREPALSVTRVRSLVRSTKQRPSLSQQADPYPHTPDGRYFVVRGRLWRLSNPDLDASARERLVHELMTARRAVRDANGDPARIALARARVDIAKRALGERGPVWWTDRAPDLNRRMVATTPYAEWFASLGPDLPSGQKRTPAA